MSYEVRIWGHQVVVDFDPVTGLFKGQFVDVDCGPFYSETLAGIRAKGEKELEAVPA